MSKVLAVFFMVSLLAAGQNPPGGATAAGGAHHPRWRKHKPTPPTPTESTGTSFSVDTCNPADHFELLCALPYTGRARQIDQSCGHCGDAERSTMSAQKILAEEWQNFQ